jgi:hypothetical protein
VYVAIRCTNNVIIPFKSDLHACNFIKGKQTSFLYVLSKVLILISQIVCRATPGSVVPTTALGSSPIVTSSVAAPGMKVDLQY